MMKEKMGDFRVKDNKLQKLNYKGNYTDILYLGQRMALRPHPWAHVEHVPTTVVEECVFHNVPVADVEARPRGQGERLTACFFQHEDTSFMLGIKLGKTIAQGKAAIRKILLCVHCSEDYHVLVHLMEKYLTEEQLEEVYEQYIKKVFIKADKD
jgi:hypothetical protein